MKQFKIIVDCTDAILTTMSCEGWQVNHLQFEAGILRAVFSRNVKPVPVVGGGVINRTLEGLGDFRPMGEGADADAVVVADAVAVADAVVVADAVAVADAVVVADANKTDEVPMVLVGLNPKNPYNRKTGRLTVEERIAKLNLELVEKMQAYWDKQPADCFVPRSLLEVSHE